jgi:hypothetical protein
MTSSPVPPVETEIGEARNKCEQRGGNGHVIDDESANRAFSDRR